MATVFNYPLDLGKSFEEQLVAQPFTLFQLMQGIPGHSKGGVREGHCFVEGLRIYLKGTPEYEQMLPKVLVASSKKADELGATPEQKKRILDIVEAKPFIASSTPFVAMHYPLADCCPYEGFMTDRTTLIVPYFKSREVVLLPFNHPREGPRNHLFYDARGTKLADSRWHYEGTLADAVREFHAGGYALHQAKYAAPQLMALNAPTDRQHLIVASNITLEQAIKIIEGAQKTGEALK